MRRLSVPSIIVSVVSAVGLLALAAGQAAAAPAPTAVPDWLGVPVSTAKASGTFAAYKPGATAVTYRTDLVPTGATARVLAFSAPSPLGTTTRLLVSGLQPKHQYGAHVHTDSCGATGDAAGPHFQHEPDPVTPSVDPRYANPKNEIWLDFTTDARGRGLARSHVDWQFTDRHPRSVVIHEMHTHTDPGHAGTAGARLACINVGF
jgi:Cu-Zn family superoxide dismutase